jgi:hypothetical protein
MIQKKYLATSLICTMTALYLLGCSHTTQPAETTIQAVHVQSSVAASIVSDELTVSQLGGIAIDSSNGEFSIGWNQFVGPLTQTTERVGDASVVVFDSLVTISERRSPHAGKDIGSVYLNYSGNHQEFKKIQHPFGGTFYSIFQHLFGQTSAGVSFAGNTSYEFEVTGSSSFSAVKVAITSPSALINITSHANGQQVSADSNLTLAWLGGNPTGSVLVRVTPMIGFGPDGFAPCDSGIRMGDRERRGPGGMPPGIRDGGPGRPMRIDSGYTILLANNPGAAVISAATIQQILDGATQLSVTVSQLTATEFDHDGGKYRLVMRDGDRRMLIVN